MVNCFQALLSNSTCAATTWRRRSIKHVGWLTEEWVKRGGTTGQFLGENGDQGVKEVNGDPGMTGGDIVEGGGGGGSDEGGAGEGGEGGGTAGVGGRGLHACTCQFNLSRF